MEAERSLIVVVVDMSLTNTIVCEGKISMSQYLDAIIAFINCHLMLKSTNQIALIAIDTMNSEFIYPDDEIDTKGVRQSNGQCEIFSHVEYVLRSNISKFMQRSFEEEISASEPLLEAACSQALCYITRLENELDPGDQLNARMLIITGGENECDKYVRCMNIIYTAQKQNVRIDVCSLEHEIALLQQACDITEGIFFKVPQMGGFLQYLLWIFLPDPIVRKKLVVPSHGKVDYRPYCFCHKHLIDIGYVCSICLSIFCKFSPICTTCEVVFKTPATLSIKPKKKKIKNN